MQHDLPSLATIFSQTLRGAMDKKTSRLRRARRARAKIKELVVHRLCVYRTPRHIYAQLIAPNGAEVGASA
jgi:large subunit ribosomal protein L18